MSFSHLIRVLFAIALSGAIGWVSLVAFNFIKITQQFEAVEAAAPNADPTMFITVVKQAIHDIQGGSAVFLGAGIAGVLLSEIFRTRSLLLYAAATGALTAVLAAALWEQINTVGTAQAAAGLAMAGFVAGGVYWVIAGPSDARG
jgi:hypothetical protein